MASNIIRQKKVAGSDLIMDETFNGFYHYFKWETIYIATIKKGDDKYEMSPYWDLGESEECDYSSLYGNFKTKDEAFDYVERYIAEHEDFQHLIQQKHQAAKDEKRKQRESTKAEKAKHYHLELADLTPTHNLYYSDLISARLRNVLKAGNMYTIEDLSHWERSELLKFRNCGKQVAEEVEKLFQQVGLDWSIPNPQPKQTVDLSQVSDEALIAECKRRNLKL